MDFAPQKITSLSPEPPNRPEIIVTVAWFALLLGFSLWGVGVGWQSLNLPGHEFRQTQTALSAYTIQQTHDFSLAYPTPVLGKPWSVPMEFPLYQWTVVGLSNATGLTLTKAGRLVSIFCFYGTLPVMFLLLGRLGLSWSRRLVALGLVVCCPLYLFYARSFLIETMALLFSLVFLWSYLNAVERRRVGWAWLAVVSGGAAGLVKVTTFAFILLPAFGWVAVWLWRQRPGAPGGSWRGVARVAAWALGVVLLPCVVSLWWVHYADAIKALNPMADFLVSKHMWNFTFGTSATRFAAVIWRPHWAILSENISSWWILAGTGLLALGFARRWWSWIALLLDCFFAVQVIFPELYAWHDYYYVANAFTLMLAMGLVLCGVLESRLPRPVVWLLVLAVSGGQVWRFVETDYPAQQGISRGGDSLTRTLKAVTAPEDLLIITGSDWSSEIPYFAQRRALVIRRMVEDNQNYVDQGLRQLQGERIGALVLGGKQQRKHWLIDRLVRDFGLDRRPVYTAGGATVYLHQQLWLEAISTLREMKKDNTLELTAEATVEEQPLVQHEVELELLSDSFSWVFAGMSPVPWKFYATVGLDRCRDEGGDYFAAHPVTRLWFKVPAGPRRISVEVGLLAAAYAESVSPGDRSDGVELAIYEETPGGVSRQVYSRWLNPRDEPADRGIQQIECSAEFVSDTVVQIAVLPGPNHSDARDWAVLGKIEIK